MESHPALRFRAASTAVRALLLTLAFVLAAVVVTPVSPAVAATPVLATFVRTSAATVDVGAPVSFNFTTSVAVKRVEVGLHSVAGKHTLAWTAGAGGAAAAGASAGTVAGVASPSSWPNGAIEVSYVQVITTAGASQVYYRGGGVYPPGTGAAPFGDPAAQDFKVRNPSLPYAAPVPTSFLPAKATFAPGQTAGVQVKLSQLAQAVRLVYRDASEVTPFELTWAGNPAPGPQTITATGAITAAQASGKYTLERVEISYFDGLAKDSYLRDGTMERTSPVPLGTAVRAGLATGDITVSNPAKVLQKLSPSVAPRVAGDLVPNTILTIQPGTWPVEPSFSEIQWYRNGTPIDYSTKDTYQSNMYDDPANMIWVKMTARAAGYLPTSVSTLAFGPMPRRVWVSNLRITGDASVGGVLHLEHGAAGVDPEGGQASYTYVWKRNGTPIPGATSRDYRTTLADKGNIITAGVTARFDAGSAITEVVDLVGPLANKTRGKGFNADGTGDIFARDTGGNLWLYPSNGSGGWLPAQKIGQGWNGFNSLFSPGDFDGDGNVDVMARDGAGRLFLYQGNGQGGWLRSFQIGQGWGSVKDIVAPGDFNGDGTADLIARDASNTMVMYPGNGRGGFLTPYTLSGGWGDFNAFISPSSRSIFARDNSGNLRSYSGSGNGYFHENAWTPNVFGAYAGYGWEGFSRIGAPGDFDSDGVPEVYGIHPDGRLTMFYGLGHIALKRQATIGWGWNSFNSVF
ncbi:FG-GAP-like repeat-containing protein [Paenarthrobacter sp. OM7]|uniref:FG-GAP-like repeat-containing protein n=1 Tax=Paenarthrobacter sp. OM7 TaxID=3041264 RepID=UPI002468C0BA|nr:FG-GAP-like repeat-containing protein [Paenarthrobacter sp. OM7]WGM20149.1 FG-GAP-like repeat-containing protein [Paenarthrobacter sp. OM7]